jgi:MSHA biogenesis protein MshJ
MKQWWQKWSDRLDAMSLRERAIVFFAAALVVVFIFQSLLGGPTTDRQRQIARQLAQKHADTRALQDEVQKLLGARTQDPDAGRRAQIEALKKQIADVNARLADKQRELVPADRIPGLLEEILRRDRKLELVDLHSIPAVPLFGESDKAGEVAAAAAARAGLQVYRHGVEVTVRGNYFDLMHYLDNLEKLPLRMFWREVDVATTNYPTITMKLTVYTLSLERAWLVV